ncbi:hypothetical protein [Streptomonospora salina]|uniref:Uncharacterized protein n=1 Tax=Streptomonospora salina TaxID=104205 RepID=A0A841DZT5_9ACTN|nr:hypothetical protein [Streptomonospora salina]MBB5996987.1 hypothetical protein [Streptomonospora salina]
MSGAVLVPDAAAVPAYLAPAPVILTLLLVPPTRAYSTFAQTARPPS